jgi:hypothetical protein
MTPLEHVQAAAIRFTATYENPVYHFSVPDGTNAASYVQQIRKYALRLYDAKQLSRRWSVSHNVGRAWIIKQK